jgi:hypothetical protein
MKEYDKLIEKPEVLNISISGRPLCSVVVEGLKTREEIFEHLVKTVRESVLIKAMAETLEK